MYDIDNKGIKIPYLPEVESPETYTLVLDLDETLVHYIEVNYFYKKIKNSF